MNDRRIPGVRKIAVLRANGVGDLLFALPALEALKAAYPGASLTLLGRAWHARFFAGRPGPIDRVVVVPTETDGADPIVTWREADGAERFLDEMRREGFDLALQMHGGGGNSNPLVNALGARLTAGSCDLGAEPLDRWIPYLRFHNEVLRYLEIAALVGAEPVTLAPRIAVTDRDREEAAPLLGDGERPLAVLNPGARDPRRRWPAERFAAVGDALVRAGAEVVVNADPGEQELAAAVLSAMRHPARDVGPSLSLGGLAALLERAAVLVSNDTGPLHLGMAVGAPAVGIYWCGNAITSGPSTCADRAWHLSWRTRCPTCDRDCIHEGCSHDASFVVDVAEAEVTASALRLLEGSVSSMDRPRPRSRPARADGARREGERIAVLRALQLGDMLCAIPALRALRKARPEARITLVGLPWHERLRARFPRYIDEVAALPGYPGLPEQPARLEELPGFLADLRARRFDLALQLHGAGTITNPLTLALGAGRAAGFFRPGELCPDEGTFPPWDDDEHEVLRWLRLLERLGVPADGTHLELPILPDEEAEAEAFLEEHGLAGSDYVCVHPGARLRDKCWPAEGFAEVADALAADGLRVVLTGAPAETDLTGAVGRAMAAPAIDSARAALSLGGMAAVIRGARALVANDTGVSHVAAALEVPSAIAFTRADPRRWAPLDADRHRALWRPRPADLLREARALLARYPLGARASGSAAGGVTGSAAARPPRGAPRARASRRGGRYRGRA